MEGSQLWKSFVYMEGENPTYYKDHEQIEIVLLKPSVIESMFTS